MPLQQTSGNDTVDAYGGGVAAVPNYIENVFSTWLYDGNSTARNIQNGIDLAGKGGMVWIKTRTQGSTGWNHVLYDTARGANNFINSNTTAAQNTSFTDMLTGFNADGFSLGVDANTGLVNQTGYGGYASWTFRKQPKFFDVVTYTGTGSATTIAHNLGSVPGCIIVKRTNTTSNWQVYHNGLTSAAYSIQLNQTSAQASAPTVWNSTAPTSTVFSVGTSTDVNASGGTYVAYIYAHNAGGFGLTGTDNVISCGSYTGNGSNTSGPTITLGYEPQWLLVKRSDSTGNWVLIDVMRGMPVNNTSGMSGLVANSSGAEYTESSGGGIQPTATGFTANSTWGSYNASGGTYIYIAIRRGPMKVPTDGTKVFAPIAANAAAGTVQTTNFVIDSQWKAIRAGNALNTSIDDRLRGISTTSTASGQYLITSSTAIEATTNATTQFWDNKGFQISTYYASASDIFWNFGRAPSFFDVVCYTGTGAALTVNHNLGVAPELVIVKNRAPAGDGREWSVTFNFGGSTYSSMLLNQTSAASSISYSNAGNPIYCSAAPTATTFSVGKNYAVSYPANGLVAYLFASCPGVSKVGSYTGNGSTQTINCGFAGGARFVLIKRTDSTGDWYVYDTARGMTTLTDPYLLLDSTAAESATLGSVTSVTTGFAVNASILAAINTNAASYIYLAIA